MTINTINNNVALNNGSISCPSCNSTHIQKRGYSKNGRMLSCVDCGKRFSRSWDELKGTRFAENIEVNNNEPDINRLKDLIDEDKNTTTNSIIPNITDNTETDKINHEPNNDEDEIIDFDEEGKADLLIARAKRDENGNFLLKVNGNAPVPVGSTADELKNIIRQNGGCKMSMTKNGIFVLTVATTTKGC